MNKELKVWLCIIASLWAMLIVAGFISAGWLLAAGAFLFGGIYFALPATFLAIHLFS